MPVLALMSVRLRHKNRKVAADKSTATVAIWTVAEVPMVVKEGWWVVGLALSCHHIAGGSENDISQIFQSLRNRRP